MNKTSYVVAALAVVVLAFVLGSCSAKSSKKAAEAKVEQPVVVQKPKSPMEVVSEFFVAVKERRYNDAESYFSYAFRQKLASGSRDKIYLWKNFLSPALTMYQELDAVEPLKEIIRGDTASVFYVMYFTNGEFIGERIELGKENGEWKIIVDM